MLLLLLLLLASGVEEALDQHGHCSVWWGCSVHNALQVTGWRRIVCSLCRMMCCIRCRCVALL